MPWLKNFRVWVSELFNTSGSGIRDLSRDEQEPSLTISLPLPDHNQSARSSCRTNLTQLGHSDSYTGVSQSTSMCQLLTTSGQGKLSFLDRPAVTIFCEYNITYIKWQNGIFVSKRKAKYDFWFGRSCLQQYSLEEHNQSVRSSCRNKHACLGHSDLNKTDKTDCTDAF